TGDKYLRDAAGSYVYAGRSDDMLKVSGQFVSPFEVEATLVRHPAVLEAAVIGTPDENGITRSKAFVVLKAGQSPTAALESELKVGLMLPYSGTYAALGTAIENGFRLYLTEQGGRIGGREIEFFKVDDESEPAKAVDNVNKLIKRDNVDVLVGTVHSGVAMAMAKAAKDNGTLLIIPNAGADEITGPMCAPNIFRTSFSNSQPAIAMGKVAAEKGHR